MKGHSQEIRNQKVANPSLCQQKATDLLNFKNEIQWKLSTVLENERF